MDRSSGILLHPTSLPGRFGIGEIGAEARRFIDFLAGAKQRIWQVLPLGETGFGNSPYQCFSAFAGNPLLIDLDRLAEAGYLSVDDLAQAPAFPPDQVDYDSVLKFKLPALKAAARKFRATASKPELDSFARFCRSQRGWLEDYALFMALKEAHGGCAWTDWEPELAGRNPVALARRKDCLGDAVFARQYWQFEFFRQWTSLHQYCWRRGIQVMGDIPIYVAHDSADVWAHPELFHLDDCGRPLVLAGVPPDYFSATGQLWGNPLYRWDVIAASGYKWWIERFRANRSLADILRLDHFRGFQSYWEVPAGEASAIRGRWVKGPGADLFHAVRNALGKMPIVAENLGLITPEVEALRTELGLPGMAVLQFAFASGPESRTYQPHRFVRELAAYTGTHDNDTIVGWWTSEGAGASTRDRDEAVKEREFAKKYLATDGTEIHWVFIRALLASAANWVLVPLQDVLGLGAEARMNTPGRPSGNWRWRFRREMLTSEIRDRLREMTEIYERA